MATDPVHRTMPGAFLNNDELPGRNWTAPPAITTPSRLDTNPQNETMRHNPMKMPLRPARPMAPTMPIFPQISPFPQVTALPPQPRQRQEVSRGGNDQWRQLNKRFQQRDEEFSKRDKREEEAWRQQDEVLHAQDEALSRQDDELSRQYKEAFGYQEEMPNYTFGTPERHSVTSSQMRNMPGSFDAPDDYRDNSTSSDNHNNFTSPAELPSQRQFDSEDAPYRNDLHILDPSSHYSLLLNGQIGSTPELTTLRTPGTRIKQNVRVASATLRQDPNRPENIQMSANLAGNWPNFDIGPDIAHAVVGASPTPPRTPKPSTPSQTTAGTTAATTTATPTSATKRSATTTAKSSKSPKQKPKAAPLSRGAEHKSHIDKLASLEASQICWSQTGEKYNVKYSTLGPAIQSQLTTSTKLGAGHFGTVQRVVCSGVPLARKTIRPTYNISLESIRKEVDNVKGLAGHHHIIQLVGTYITEEYGQQVYHILTFPVADCDIDTYLKDYEASLSGCDAATIEALSIASGLSASASRYTPLSAQLATFLKATLGCITSAIKFMHLSQISHDDIKPANVLLRHGQVYLTDFGISRDRSAATQTSTEFFAGFTYGWTAPEKEGGELHNPMRADIYSLGCIFMHVISLLSGKKKIKDCAEILNRLPSHREEYIEQHFASIYRGPWSDGTPPESYQKLIDMTKEMLRNDRALRPIIIEVNDRLLAMGGDRKAFHGPCCHQPHSDTFVKAAEAPVCNGAATTTSSRTPSQPTPQPVSSNTLTTVRPAVPKEMTAEDDDSVTITSATLHQPATNPPSTTDEMPADGEMV